MTSCIICGCVKDCEKYLDNVFINIKKIQTLFDKSKIIISYDKSSDKTLNKLSELRKKFDIDIIINKNPLTNIRTLNIENARNKIMNKINNEYNDYDYFIMLDMDDVTSKPINIDILKESLAINNKWDGLTFNNKNYYDFWALSFKDFQYSLWHSNNPKKLINVMKKELDKETNNKDNLLINCESAFGGFGIYKISKFKNCYYKSKIELNLINKQSVINVINNYNIKFNIDANIYDCEHRFFHLNAKKNNNVRFFIYNKFLFPPYEGEHTSLIDL